MDKITLDRNENFYGPAPACYRVLREAGLEQMSLYSRDFQRGRKSELSDRLSRRLGLPEERLLLSYGSEDMLKQVVQCYLRPGETILLPQQSWWYYKAIAKETRGICLEYPLIERGDRFEFDAGEILRLARTREPRLVLIASPNNPTGSSMDRAALVDLIERCPASIIVLDEAYHGFSEGTGDEVKELLGRHPRFVLLRTFSKYYALAGLRVGYAGIGEGLKDLVVFAARYLGYNQLTEKIALAALDDEEYYRGIAALMRKDKKAYMKAFGELTGFKPFHSEANFMMLRYPTVHKETLNAGLKARGIIVKFLDDPGVQDCLRITIGTEEQNRRAREAFAEVAASFASPTLPSKSV